VRNLGINSYRRSWIFAKEIKFCGWPERRITPPKEKVKSPEKHSQNQIRRFELFSSLPAQNQGKRPLAFLSPWF